MQKDRWYVVWIALICCALMTLVDGVWRPGYAVKSVVKIILFLGVPLLACKFCKGLTFWELLRPQKKGLILSVGLGVGLYAVILGGYFILAPFFDFSAIAGSLTENAGVTKDNFLFVSLYISFVNSLLEEFFFRGFLFSNIKPVSRGGAYLFSSVVFALYHVAMMLGWFSPLLFVLVMLGLTVGGAIFNYLNEKLDTIYCSWLVHMFANFAINTIGFLLLQS